MVACAMSEDARGDVVKPFPGQTFARQINDALKILVPGQHGGLNHATLLALFDHRVTRQAIQHWRKGRARMPAWARQRLIAAHEQQARKHLTNVDTIKAIPTPDYKPGAGLRRWNAERRR